MPSAAPSSSTVAAPPLPPGRVVDLPGRGRTFARVAEGPPGAPTLLLLHGWTANADLNWFRCFGHLSRRFNVVAIDHRGHGRGIRSRRPFSLSDCADDAAALVRELGYDRVIAVGYSMGGPIAQLVWKRHRALVEGLVLCATSRNFGRSAPERVMFTGMLGLSGVAKLTPAALRKRVAGRIFGSRWEQSPLGAWIAQELQRNDPATVLQAGYSIGRFSSAEWIGQVDVPTSVLVTTYDQVVATRRQLRLAESIPGAEVIRVAGDHGVCVTDPGRFVPALLDGCTRVARKAAAARGLLSASGRRSALAGRLWRPLPLDKGAGVAFTDVTLLVPRGGLPVLRRELDELQVPVWALLVAQIGARADEVELIVSSGDAPALTSATVEAVQPLEATVRPTTPLRITDDGIVALRWFQIVESDWPEFLALSEGAWPGFEGANGGVRIHGFFRTPDDPSRVLLVTRYPSLASWETSRNAPDDAGGANFRRRHELTVSTIVRTYRPIA